MKVSELAKMCTVQVKYVPYYTVLQSWMDLDHIIGNVITIYLGTTPQEFMGYRWTEVDLPLIEAHELAHLELMKEDQSEAKFRNFEDCGRETQIAAIREEVAAWKIAVKDKVLMPETLAKIHTMLNTYVYSHLRKEEM